MTSLRQRIEKLEAAWRLKQAATAVPVMFVVLNRGGRTRPLQVEHDGTVWVQHEGEDVESFKGRVKAEALAVFKPRHPLQPLFLCAKRPASADADGMTAKPRAQGVRNSKHGPVQKN